MFSILTVAAAMIGGGVLVLLLNYVASGFFRLEDDFSIFITSLLFCIVPYFLGVLGHYNFELSVLKHPVFHWPWGGAHGIGGIFLGYILTRQELLVGPQKASAVGRRLFNVAVGLGLAAILSAIFRILSIFAAISFGVSNQSALNFSGVGVLIGVLLAIYMVLYIGRRRRKGDLNTNGSEDWRRDAIVRVEDVRVTQKSISEKLSIFVWRFASIAGLVGVIIAFMIAASRGIDGYGSVNAYQTAGVGFVWLAICLILGAALGWIIRSFD